MWAAFLQREPSRLNSRAVGAGGRHVAAWRLLVELLSDFSPEDRSVRAQRVYAFSTINTRRLCRN